LIIDEALSAGDAKFSQKASARIREICAKGKIVIVVSHSMSAINEICNRCIWMDAGRIVIDGPPSMVTRAYLDKVHAEDDGAALRHFSRFLAARSFVSGWEVSHLNISSSASMTTGAIECLQPATLRIRVTSPRPLTHAILRLLVTRMDGLVVIDEARALAALVSGSDATQAEVVIEMPTVLLGPAIYKATVAMLSPEQTVMAERTTVFETYTHQPITGGRPVLYYQSELTVDRLAPLGSSQVELQQ
jgi:lipopolysaccharide transport system ATP-binding protein